MFITYTFFYVNFFLQVVELGNVGMRGAAWWELRGERDGECVVGDGEGEHENGSVEGMEAGNGTLLEGGDQRK